MQRQSLSTACMKTNAQQGCVMANLEESTNLLSAVAAQQVQVSSLGSALLSVLPLNFSPAHPGGQAGTATESHAHVQALQQH